jgi:hypothetical protein
MYAELLEGREPDTAQLESILNGIRHRRIIIYGAGRYGTMLARLFMHCGVSQFGVVDRNWEAIRTVEGREVRSPQSLADIDERNCVVIIGTGQTELLDLIASDLSSINPRLNRISGLPLVYLLHYKRCREGAANDAAPSIRECVSYHVRPYKCPIFCRHVEAMTGGQHVTGGSTLNDLGYMVGEVCTLKCEYCNEGLPYLTSRNRLPRETIIRDIRAISQACSFLHRLALVGGEPFTHPELAEIICNILVSCPGDNVSSCRTSNEHGTVWQLAHSLQ